MSEMPKVLQCQVTQCSYNKDEVCHALAITVGDGEHPHCDTFVTASRRGGDPKAVGGVGACKVTACRYNQDLECNAKNIQVGPSIDEADCLTFTP